MEAVNPQFLDLLDLLPALAAGPLLVGHWPLALLIGWAGLPL